MSRLFAMMSVSIKNNIFSNVSNTSMIRIVTIIKMVLVFMYILLSLYYITPVFSTPQIAMSNATNRAGIARNTSNLDQLAQEQRLALQIITTDSSDPEDNDHHHNDNIVDVHETRLNPSASNEYARNHHEHQGHNLNENLKLISFTDQYNLLDSQFSNENAITNHNNNNIRGSSNSINNNNNNNQKMIPKRIVISLNSPSTYNSTKGPTTKLTIGLLPTGSNSFQQEPSNSGQRENNFKSIGNVTISKSGSDKIKIATSLSNNNNKRGSNNQVKQERKKSTTMREGVIDAIHNQGGVPTLIMRNREEMNERKSPQLKFMLNSETIDEHRKRQQQQQHLQQQQRQQQQIARPSNPASPMQRSESATRTTGNISLQDELENLSNEFDSLEQQMDGNESQVREQDSEETTTTNKRQVLKPPVEVSPRIVNPHSSSSRSSSDSRSVGNFYEDNRNTERATPKSIMMSRDAAMFASRPRENLIKGDGLQQQVQQQQQQRQSWNIRANNNNNNEYSIYKSDREDDDFSGNNNNNYYNHNNNYNHGRDEENRERSESDERLADSADNFAVLAVDSKNFHPNWIEQPPRQRQRQQQQVNVLDSEEENGMKRYNYNGDNNNRYDFKFENFPNQKMEAMNNLNSAHRWPLKHDAKVSPLLANDNNNANSFYDEQVTSSTANTKTHTQDDNEQQQLQLQQHQHSNQEFSGQERDDEGRSNDMQAFRTAYTDGEPNVLNQAPALNLLNKFGQNTGSSSNKIIREAKIKSGSNSAASKTVSLTNPTTTSTTPSPLPKNNNKPTNNDNRMDDRVAQMLSRLKLYTTRDQLMKVARDLQQYPNQDETLRLNGMDGGVTNFQNASPNREVFNRNDNQRQTNFSSQQQSLSNLDSMIKPPPTATQSEANSWFGVNSEEALRNNEDVSLNESPLKAKESLSNLRFSNENSGDSRNSLRNRLEMARNRVPPPIEYSSIESYPDEQDNLLNSATDQVQNEHQPPHSDDNAGPRLLEDFRKRQERLKSMIETSEMVPNDGAGEELRSPEQSDDDSQDDYDNFKQQQQHNLPSSSQDQEDYDSSRPGGYEETSPSSNSATSTSDRNDMHDEYTNSKDLLDLFRNSARLYDADSIKRTGDLTKNPRFIPDGNEILFEKPTEDLNENEASTAATDPTSVKHEREDQEIRALEEIIDELVSREKKEEKRKEEKRNK